MTTLEKEKKEYSYKNWLIILCFASTLLPTLTVSQTITHSREITYERLNEIAKLQEHSQNQDSLIGQLNSEIKLLRKRLEAKQKSIDFLNASIINLQSQIQRLESSLFSTNEKIKLNLLTFREEKRKIKRKRFGLGLIAGVNTIGKPIFGAGISFNFVKF